MLRQIIHIDEEKCSGCGICANACHEGAIDIIDGKAKLVRENFCDGFGDCLPACPEGAISFEEREAPEYDEQAVNESRKQKLRDRLLKEMGKSGREEGAVIRTPGEGGGCPGSKMMALGKDKDSAVSAENSEKEQTPSQLNQWPCQIKLLPEDAPFFDGADLLIAADCTAYAYADMHRDFMKGKITIIGCPKLDDMDYTDKLTDIISLNNIKSVTLVRMEVPCCGGLQRAAVNAIKASGKEIPFNVAVISRDGRIVG